MVRFWFAGIALAIVAMMSFAGVVFERSLLAVDPQRVLGVRGSRVVVDASKKTVSFDGMTLAEAQGVVDATLLRDRLLVAQRDGNVLVYELPDPRTDGPPVLVQRIENVGKDLRGMITAPLVDRALVLAAGSIEFCGIYIHDQVLIDDGEV